MLKYNIRIIFFCSEKTKMFIYLLAIPPFPAIPLPDPKRTITKIVVPINSARKTYFFE